MSYLANNFISFQGEYGAFSDLAARNAYPDMKTLPCESFELAFQAVIEERAQLAMIPVENTLAGRVADVHRLIPNNSLHIVNEYFLPINHHLLGCHHAKLSDIKQALSHIHALGQTRIFLNQHHIKPISFIDTAGAAKHIHENQHQHQGAIGSHLAAEIYDLKILASNIEDAAHNITRFIVMAKNPLNMPLDKKPVITSFIFQINNTSGSLHKAIGSFAENKINITKLESYMINGGFTSTLFFVEVEGHPQSANMKEAMKELSSFAHHIKILGTYPASTFRKHLPHFQAN